MIRGVLKYFEKERATAAMFFFLVFLAVGSHLWGPESVEPVAQDYSAESRVETARDMQRVSRDMLAEWGPETRGLQAMALGLTAIVFVGLLIDILSLLHYRRHVFLPSGDFPGGPTSWGPGDVFKVLVLLFFLEAALSIGAQLAAAFGGMAVNDQSAFVMGITFMRNVLITGVLLSWVVRDRLQVAALGLWSRGWLKDIGTGFVFYTGLFPIYFGVGLVLMLVIQLMGYEPPVQTVVQIVYKEENQRLVLIFSIFIAVLGPIFEEILFRGFIYRAFRNRWGVFKALFFSSLLFAFLHAHLVAFLPVFILGAGLGLAYEKTRSLIPGMVLHMCHNMIALGMMFQIKSLA